MLEKNKITGLSLGTERSVSMDPPFGTLFLSLFEQ